MCNKKTRNELKEVLAKDPFYIAGIADYDIMEFIPSMVTEGLKKIRTIEYN